jgi:hypothetical protein
MLPAAAAPLAAVFRHIAPMADGCAVMTLPADYRTRDPSPGELDLLALTNNELSAWAQSIVHRKRRGHVRHDDHQSGTVRIVERGGGMTLTEPHTESLSFQQKQLVSSAVMSLHAAFALSPKTHWQPILDYVYQQILDGLFVADDDHDPEAA